MGSMVMQSEGLGDHVVEEPEEGDPSRIRVSPVVFEKGFLVAGTHVPGEAPGCHGEVPPTVGNSKFAEVHETHHLPTVDQDIGEAVIPVADDEILIGRASILQLADRLRCGQMLVLPMEVSLRVNQPLIESPSGQSDRLVQPEIERTPTNWGAVELMEPPCQSAD